MRVIAGALKGRQFASPRSKRTHPMSDKARGALFNVLGDVSGLRVLDAFAGTGAIAIEAVSRGAESAVAVERDARAFQVLQANLKELTVTAVQPVRANVASWLGSQQELRYDIVICDPPYDDLQPDTIYQLTERLSRGGIFVVSWPSTAQALEFTNMVHLKSHTYSAAVLGFYTPA